MAKSPEEFKRAVPQVLSSCDGEVTSICQPMVLELTEQIQVLEDSIERAETWIKSFMKRSTLCKRIAVVGGVGPITATAVVAAIGEAKEFRNGRHLSAWLGLVPRQYSSGGKSQLKGISKRGDTGTQVVEEGVQESARRWSWSSPSRSRRSKTVLIVPRRGSSCS